MENTLYFAHSWLLEKLKEKNSISLDDQNISIEIKNEYISKLLVEYHSLKLEKKVEILSFKSMSKYSFIRLNLCDEPSMKKDGEDQEGFSILFENYPYMSWLSKEDFEKYNKSK